MKSINLILLMALSFTVACHGAANKNNRVFNNNENLSQDQDFKYPKTTLEEELEFYPEVKNIFKKNECIKSKSCETQNVEAGVANLKNEQILIFEQIGIPYSAFLRYQDRISGFYVLSEEGHYSRYVPKAKVSEPILQVMQVLNAKNLPLSRQIPVLGRLIYNSSQVEILNSLEGRIDAHPRTVFELMVDKNPDANFIFADKPTISVADLCGTLNWFSEPVFQRIQNKLDSALIEITKIISENRIQFINASYLSTPETEMRNMQMVCHNSNRDVAERLASMQTHFLNRLLEQNPKVILVQGLPNDDYEMYECPFDRRWIRVAYTNIKKSEIPPEGIPLDVSILPTNLRVVRDCATVAINSGIEDKKDMTSILPEYFDENSAYFNYGGLYAYPIDIMATSWSTPLALSFIRSTNKNKNPLFVYTSVIDRVFDPVKNKQFIENR